MKIVNCTLLALAMISSLACAEEQARDPAAAVKALNDSLAFAEQSIQEVRGQEAINLLTASIAEADLTIAVAEADFVLRDIEQTQAFGALAASVANADLVIASVELQQAIASVSDDQLISELEASLASADEIEASDMILAVVSERPMLAAAVQDKALAAGLNEAMVANALTAGFGQAAATAAGK